MIEDFPKKSNVHVQKQTCGISNDAFSCGSGTAEIRHSILCKTAELQVTDCSVCESRTAELRDIVYSLCRSETAELQVTEYSLCGAELRDLKSKLLYESGTAKLQVVIYYMEAELRNFQATVFSLCGSGTAPFQSSMSYAILYAEAELRNFKFQYIPCAEAELQIKEYSMCGSGTAEL